MCSFMTFDVTFEIWTKNSVLVIRDGLYSLVYGHGETLMTSISSSQLMKNSEYFIRAIVQVSALGINRTSPVVTFGGFILEMYIL